MVHPTGINKRGQQIRSEAVLGRSIACCIAERAIGHSLTAQGRSYRVRHSYV